MEKKVQIDLNDVSIYYYTFNQGINSIKDYTMKLGFAKPFAKYKVLENVDLQIYKGEVVGILGKNGTGKSSLLRCIAGILKSYKGKLVVHGKIAPMLAIGSGIEMELTGMENIKLISSFMGSNSKKEMAAKLEEIIQFSELSIKDLNRQVKTYSTGMISRLSFSIAISETPDILLIDEVLAVGDAGFQQKCLARIQEIKESGCTILFISHGSDDVRKICTRAICINDGKIAMDGKVEKVIKFYENLY